MFHMKYIKVKMINQGDIIKHKAAMDIAIQIISARTNPETENIEVRGIWINQGQTISYIINTKEYPAGIPAEFIIKPNHLCNWLKCIKNKSEFYRTEEWKPLA